LHHSSFNEGHFLSQPTTAISSAPSDEISTGPGSALHWLQPVARGIALFFAFLFVINVFGQFRVPTYRPDYWWIPFAFCSADIEEIGALIAAIVFASYAIAPPVTWMRRRVTRVTIELLGVFVAYNILLYYNGLFHGNFRSAFPVPISLFLGLALSIVWLAVPIPRKNAAWHWPVMIVTLLLALLLAPPLQMLCFGLVEYKDKPAAAKDKSVETVAVVFGAPLSPDGHPTPMLAARIDRAIQLYQEGHVTKLYLAGGAGPGDSDEPHVMQDRAVQAGIPREQIHPQVNSDDPEATVRDVTAYFPQGAELITVSEFQQLPRIRMLFSQEEHWQGHLETAPAGDATEGTVKAMFAEIIPFWRTSLGAITH
jgi:hypothetical protein